MRAYFGDRAGREVVVVIAMVSSAPWGSANTLHLGAQQIPCAWVLQLLATHSFPSFPRGRQRQQPLASPSRPSAHSNQTPSPSRPSTRPFSLPLLLVSFLLPRFPPFRRRRQQQKQSFSLFLSLFLPLTVLPFSTPLSFKTTTNPLFR
jgi:hypothetical protein